MTAVAIIQARMTSSRLPGKVMADIAGKPALEQMIARVLKSKRLGGVVVATTSNTTDDRVAELAKRLGVGLFRGEEADVLGRLYAAAIEAKADPVVRLTADCPLADPAVIDAALALYDNGGADYVSNCNRRTFPDGCDVEVFSAAALAIAHREARHPALREHVTPYIRGNLPNLGMGDFRRADLLAEADFGHIRFTVDTEDDLALMRSLFERLPEGFGWLDAVALATRRPAGLMVTQPPQVLAGLALRPATNEDAPLLFRWLNDPEHRSWSFQTVTPVAWVDHQAWLDGQLAGADNWLAIAVYDGIAAGQVRAVLTDGAVVVSIYVDAAFRSRGVGRLMIEEACKTARNRWPGRPLAAHVRLDNPASVAFFRKNGFSESNAAADRTVLLRTSAA